MATVNGQNTFHANRARVVVAGQVVAEAINVSANESGGASPIRVVGQVEAVEHVHNAYDATVQMSKWVWREGAAARFNVGNGLVQIPEFDLEAYDTVTNRVLFIARRCTIGNRGMQVSANQPIQQNVSIMAIRIEAGTGNRNLTPITENEDQPTGGDGGTFP